jgi:hypothetical protein
MLEGRIKAEYILFQTIKRKKKRLVSPTKEEIVKEIKEA